MNHTKLLDITSIASSITSYVANGASQVTYIKQIIVHNYGSVTADLSLFNVPDSSGSLGTAAAANRFVNRTMAVGETFILELALPIILSDQNDSIFAASTVASTLNIQIQGARE